MTILPLVTTLKGFEECIKSASVAADGRFSIRNEAFSYDQLAGKFESLIPAIPLPGDRALARKIFTHLKNLAGPSDRMESIRKKLLYTKEEASPENDKLFTAMLRELFKEDPHAAAKLILADRDAEAVARAMQRDGITMFALAESIFNWEVSAGIDFDKRFTIEEHETNYPIIFERRLADWIETGGAADNLSNRKAAAEKIRAAYNGGQPGENTVLDLRGLQLTTIPAVIDAIPKLQRLHIENGAVLQNPKSIQHLSRDVVLDLIKANHTHFRHVNRDLIDETFIFDALSRNAAVLQYLRSEVQGDMLFLLEAANRAPEILAYVPEGVKSDRDFMLSLVNAFAFGKDKWEKYFGAVGDVPALPDDIVDILSSDDPYSTDLPRKKVAETHMLVLIPKVVKGKPLSLNTFRELVKAPITGNKSDNLYIHDKITTKYGAKKPDLAKWVLMTKDVIPGSRNQSYQNQQKLLKPRYEVPDLLSATVGILAHYVRTGERLFSDKSYIYTRCMETVDKCQTVVGGAVSVSLILASYKDDNAGVGLAALRKFS